MTTTDCTAYQMQGAHYCHLLLTFLNDEELYMKWWGIILEISTLIGLGQSHTLFLPSAAPAGQTTCTSHYRPTIININFPLLSFQHPTKPIQSTWWSKQYTPLKCQIREGGGSTLLQNLGILNHSTVQAPNRRPQLINHHHENLYTFKTTYKVYKLHYKTWHSVYRIKKCHTTYHTTINLFYKLLSKTENLEHPGFTEPAPISMYSCSELQLAMIKYKA